MSVQIFPALDSATEAALRASIERFGVLVAVVRDQDGQTLDGHHRSRIAEELGVDYPVNTVEVADRDEAREIARTLNEDRRQLPREQRREVVKALREEGHSQRAIAGALGVSDITVRRDLEGASYVAPDRVEGQDGKSYPARKPKPELQPGPAREPEPVVAPMSRKAQMNASAAARKLGQTLASIDGYQQGIETTLRVDRALLAASPDEIKEWIRIIGEATKTLRRLRRTLKEAQANAA